MLATYKAVFRTCSRHRYSYAPKPSVCLLSEGTNINTYAISKGTWKEIDVMVKGKKKTSGRPSVCEVGFLRLKFSSWEVRFESFWSVQQRRANTMKDPMLEIVSAVLDRSLFLGVAFTFFPYFFFYPNGWWVQPQACDDGDDSPHFLVLFGATSCKYCG